MIIRKYRATCEVADIIHGNINSDELYIHLMMNSDAFNEQMKIEIREEYERHQRENLLQEQKQAYQESLEADRAKEQAKQQKEKMIATERRRQESERAETESRKEAIRKDVRTQASLFNFNNVWRDFSIQAESTLPSEPRLDCPDVTKVRFRKPGGDFMERRFTVDTKLKVRKESSGEAVHESLTLFFPDFAQFRHGQRIPARWIQSYLKLSKTRCKSTASSQRVQA